jgi:hypothetical protein
VKRVAGSLAVLLAGLLAGCGSGGGSSTNTTSTTKQDESVQVQLQEENFSGEDGTVTLTPSADGKKTKVDIVMASYAANEQPAHIHKGTCQKLDATPAYPLHNVVVGKSLSVVPVSLDHLLSGRYAINVHRSAKKLKIYVACGDITRNSAPTPTVTTGEGGSG